MKAALHFSFLLVPCLFFMFTRAQNAEPRLVFAHYMLFAQDSVEMLKNEIQLAQSKGIDAFALNTNKWRPERAYAIFQAAEELGTDFKLFFSADMHPDDDQPSLSVQNLTVMLTAFANHSNYMKYRGKLFFSSWLGEDAPWEEVFQRAGGKDKFFFVPFFRTAANYLAVKSKIDNFTDVIDGLHGWDTSAWPFQGPDFQNVSAAQDQAYLAVCNESGKVYMASSSPWFFKNLEGCCSDACNNTDLSASGCNCRVMGNYQGPGLWIEKWKELVDLGPPLVEIVTWNDWKESSYVVAPPASEAADAAGFSHRAFLELGEHYIRWYKSGSPPAVTEDALYMFYYTHTKNLTAPADGCPVARSAALADKLYVTSMLTRPATVELRSGGDTRTFDGEAGISTWSMDFEEGEQVAILKRGGDVVNRLSGNKSVSNSNVTKANFNVYSTCTKRECM